MVHTAMTRSLSVKDLQALITALPQKLRVLVEA